MKFGWMTLSLSPSPADDLACVHQQLEQGVLAEAMGFDYLWLTEHNFTGECAYADPIPFAGALAARTSRARTPRPPDGGDVSRAADTERFGSEGLTRFGQIDVLVNDAAAPHGADRRLLWDSRRTRAPVGGVTRLEFPGGSAPATGRS